MTFKARHWQLRRLLNLAGWTEEERGRMRPPSGLTRRRARKAHHIGITSLLALGKKKSCDCCHEWNIKEITVKEEMAITLNIVQAQWPDKF